MCEVLFKYKKTASHEENFRIFAKYRYIKESTEWLETFHK